MASLNTELRQTKFLEYYKTFSYNESHFHQRGIMIFDGRKITTNETELVEVFRKHSIKYS